MSAAARVRLQQELFRLLRHPRVRVEAGGPEGEIAVIGVGPRDLPPLLDLKTREAAVAAARAAGFRWAALDLSLPEDPGGAGSAEAGTGGGCPPRSD